MSARKAKIYFITITEYHTVKEAWDDAQAYRKKLRKWCAEGNYSAICVMGTSENDLTFGEMHYGYRGKKEFVKTNAFDFMPNTKRPFIPDVIKQPHLHIVLFCIPGKTLRDDTKDYFKGKGHGVNIADNNNYDVHAMLRYTMMQSKKTVRTYENVDALPQLALREFVKSAESVNRMMNGNKNVFFRLPLSQELFYADASILEEENLEVFAEYCLSQEKLNELRDAEGQVYELFKKGKQFPKVFTTKDIDGDAENTVSQLSSKHHVRCGNNDEVFTETDFSGHSAPEDVEFDNNLFSHNNGEFLNNYCDFLDSNDSSNSLPELEYNSIYNNINNTNNPISTHKTPSRPDRTMPCYVPQNVIDGLAGFLDMIFPSGTFMLDSS